MKQAEKRQLLFERIQAVDELPALSLMTQKIDFLASDPETRPSVLARAISAEPSLAVRLVRLANSAFFALSRQVDSVQSAIVLLGMNTVRNLNLGASVLNGFSRLSKPENFDRDRYWKSCLAGAVCAREIARRRGRKNPENHFLAGMIRDTGLLVMAYYLPEEYALLLDRFSSEGSAFPEGEIETLGMGHGTVGSLLMEKWNFPWTMVEAVEYHHYPASASDAQNVDTELLYDLCMADYMVQKHPEYCFPFLVDRLPKELEGSDAWDSVLADSILENLDENVREMMEAWEGKI